MVCLVLFGIRILITYYEIHNNKTDIKMKTSEILSKDIKYLKEDSQIIKADDYIFTLEKYYFESDINVGHCLISIMQEGKKGKEISCELDNPARGKKVILLMVKLVLKNIILIIYVK